MLFSRKKKNRKCRGHLRATRKSLRMENLEDRVLLTTVHGDFNGDGYDDLAVGVPYEDVGGIASAGVVYVTHGSASGLTAGADQVWHQNSRGIKGAAEANDHFGQSLAVGDFDGDGYDDLAIGVPGEDIGSIDGAGAVNVLYGSASGLTASGDQMWHQNTSGILNVAEAGDQFGSSLATGDFDGDGRDDLAIGVPGEDIGGHVNAGAVNVIYGRSNTYGLTTSDNQVWYQDTFGGLWGGGGEFGNFGTSVAAGDFNGDGNDDLAIGVPGQSIGLTLNAGAVNVIYGRSGWWGGLRLKGSQFWHEDSTGMHGMAEKDDQFGSSLVTGDFNGDGRDDLVVGIPYEDVGTKVNAGAVNVIYGRSSTAGLTASGNQVWHQATYGIAGSAEPNDLFGYALAAGNFNGDGRYDLAIGVPGEDIGAIVDAGAVNVIYGRSNTWGLTASGDQMWHQDTSGIVGEAERNDRFGSSLTAGNFNGDTRDDLAVWVPGESVTGLSLNAGAVNVIYGRYGWSGLNAENNRMWYPHTLGILDLAEGGKWFGF